MQPHWQQTHACLEAEPIVLLVQDTTEIDLSHRAKMSGLGQIGNVIFTRFSGDPKEGI
jgi:hypothetical protein